MIDISNISNRYTDRVVESVFSESAIFPNYQQFLRAVSEYKELTRWHWKRKRELEPIIASLSVNIASSIDKYLKKNPQTVRFTTGWESTQSKEGGECYEM